jgi:hypothetical protein
MPGGAGRGPQPPLESSAQSIASRRLGRQCAPSARPGETCDPPSGHHLFGASAPLPRSSAPAIQSTPPGLGRCSPALLPLQFRLCCGCSSALFAVAVPPFCGCSSALLPLPFRLSCCCSFGVFAVAVPPFLPLPFRLLAVAVPPFSCIQPPIPIVYPRCSGL